MEKYEESMKALALRLFEINAFKFGDFKMKIGINSPIYFDLRVIVSYPDVMNTLSDLLVEFINQKNLACDQVCGVPYTALPIATLISIKNSKPMLVRRKEPKSYGTKKIIEGVFKVGDNCLIIEDIVTTGSSILETVRDLREHGVQSTDIVVVVDREQGGFQNLAEQRINMHPLFTLSYLLNVLKECGKIEEGTVQSVAQYIKACQLRIDGSFVNKSPKVVNALARTSMPFEARAGLAKCEITKDLFSLMCVKKTNLCLAADVTKAEEILNLAETCGPYICILKTHVDIVENFNEDFINRLMSLAKKHNFLIMEDRKFADIGSTVDLQYSNGTFHISKWANLVTAHAISGPSIIQGLKAGLSTSDKRGVFLLAEMSSQGNLINEKYKEATIKLATECVDTDFIAGIVCQSADCFGFPGLIQLTPGVKIDDSSDNLGQQYQSPEYIIKEKGADVAVVGRGIIKAKSIEKAAIMYRDRLWNAYCERIGLHE